MANFKVALSADVRGASVHSKLEAARKSQKKQGLKYKIFRWVEYPGKENRGSWFEMK